MVCVFELYGLFCIIMVIHPLCVGVWDVGECVGVGGVGVGMCGCMS